MFKRSSFVFLALFSFTALYSFAAEGDVPPPMPPVSTEQNFMQTIMMVAIALAFFYLIMWRPEQKRRKQQEEKRNNLKIGDRISAVLVVGEVQSINDDTVVLKTIDGNRIEVAKSGIHDLFPSPGEKK